MYEYVLKNYNPNDWEGCGSSMIHAYLRENPKDDPFLNNTKLPSRIVYPFAEDYKWSDYRNMMFKETHKLPDECIGIHWYAGNNQYYNNLITHENYHKHNMPRRKNKSF